MRKIQSMNATSHNNPVVQQLTLNGWLVELRTIARNYPRVQDGIHKLSVNRILLARRLEDSSVPSPMNNDLAKQLKVVGLC